MQDGAGTRAIAGASASTPPGEPEEERGEREEEEGAMPPLVLVVSDCRAAHARMKAAGVEFTQEPVDRYGTVDAGFRDPSGNGWKMIQSR